MLACVVYVCVCVCARVLCSHATGCFVYVCAGITGVVMSAPCCCGADAASLLWSHAPALRATPLRHFEEAAGFSFGSPPAGGPQPLTARSLAWEVRLFLYWELGLRDAFVGDGMLYDAAGSAAGEEWLALNCDVAAEVVDIGALLREPPPPPPPPPPVPAAAAAPAAAAVAAAAAARVKAKPQTALLLAAGVTGVCVLGAVAWLLLRKGRA